MSPKKKQRRDTAPSRRKLQLVSDPKMPFGYVEAYKSLRTNLKFINAASNAGSFVVTSALGMESKSNVAVNLAVTLAEENKRFIVVDGDLRKPAVQRMLRLKTEGRGFSAVLTGELAFAEAVVHVEHLGIDVLPAGTLPPNPTELLSQERARALLDFLREYYDYVIVDAPPVSVVTDAAIIGRMVDGALLVVRSDYAPVEMVKLAQKRLEDVQVPILGVILTRFEPKKSGRQSGYYYSYKGYYEYDRSGE